MLLIIFGCLLEVKLRPLKRACAVTFVYVVAVEIEFSSKNLIYLCYEDQAATSHIYFRKTSNNIAFEAPYSLLNEL